MSVGTKLLSWFGPGLVKKLAGPSQTASIARGALKYVGGALSGLGYSQAAIVPFLESSEAIVAGLITLVIAQAFSFANSLLNKKKVK